MSKSSRIACDNCSSVAMVYNAYNPSQVWLQRKTYGVPYAIFTGALCPAGGNGWGDVPDTSPRDTLIRELLREEVVGPAAALFTAVMVGAKPWQAMLVPTSKLVADMSLGNKRPALLTRVSYFAVPVSAPEWEELELLQAAHPNLLNEGKSVIISLSDVVRMGERFAYGHDQAMAIFWAEHGLDTDGMQIYPNGEVSRLPWCETYDEVFKQFEVARRPNRYMVAS